MSKVKQYYTDVAEKNVDAIITKLKQNTSAPNQGVKPENSPYNQQSA